MKTIIHNWNGMRIFRLLLAVAVLVQAFIQKDILMGLIAAFLGYTAIANKGCCGSNGCAVNTKPQIIKKTVEYEELDVKK